MKATSQSFLIFLSFLLFALYLYWDTRIAGFVTDFYGWQERYEAGRFSGIWTSFGFPALHPVLHLVNYTWYTLFKTNGLAYYLLYTFFHSLNAWLLFHTFHRVFHIFKIKAAFWTSLFAAACFLLSPYQTEVLVWRVCLHYLMATGLIIIALKYTIEYLENPSKNNYLWRIHGAFLVALFTLEISLMTPFILLTYLLFWSFSFAKTAILFSHLKKIIFPQLLALGSYFSLNRALFGSIVGHYGAETHLNFPLLNMAANYFKYLTKYIGFIRYYKHQYKTTFFHYFDQSFILGVLLVVLTGLLILGIIYFKKISNRVRLLGMSLFLIALALFPIANLYFVDLQLVENDRYGYFASIFIYTFLSLLLFTIPKYFRYPLLIGYLGVSIFYLQKTTKYWSESAQLYHNLVDDFRWYDADEVLILNIPDNYHGIHMFRRYDSDEVLTTPLILEKNRLPKGTITSVAQYNPPTPLAGANATIDSAGIIKVELNQWGDWWWRKGMGAINYETEKFSVRFSDIKYQLELKNFPSNGVLIYQDGEKWKELKR